MKSLLEAEEEIFDTKVFLFKISVVKILGFFHFSEYYWLLVIEESNILSSYTIVEVSTVQFVRISYVFIAVLTIMKIIAAGCF